MIRLLHEMVPETDLERRIMLDQDWVDGLSYGTPRRGHPEGAVVYHIPAVLANVEKYAIDLVDRNWLRVVALVHDNFKYQVDRTKDRTGENHHGWLARHFAERYVTNETVLTVIEFHDEAFLSWKKAISNGKLSAGTARAERLILRLSELPDGAIPFFMRFFKCDNETGDKIQDSVRWFQGLLDVSSAEVSR